MSSTVNRSPGASTGGIVARMFRKSPYSNRISIRFAKVVARNSVPFTSKERPGVSSAAWSRRAVMASGMVARSSVIGWYLGAQIKRLLDLEGTTFTSSAMESLRVLSPKSG